MKEGRFLQGHRFAAFFTGPRRPALLAALVTVGLLVTVWWGAHDWYRGQLLAARRAQILTELSPYSNALSRTINRRLGILKGLKAFVEPHLSEPTFATEFERFAAGLYAATTGVRVLTVAPRGIPRYVYPLSGNESVIGHDPMRDPRPGVRADVERAIQSREITLSGPDELRPGGLGLVARLAVYKDQIFWGFVTIALDLENLLKGSGLSPGPADLKLALRANSGHVFFGDRTVFDVEPVIYRVELPEGFWELAAIPTGGWNASIRRALRLFDLAALAIASLLTAIAYLAVNRDARLALGVQERTEELRKAHDELETRVKERTRELANAKEALETEIEQRNRTEQEVNLLLTITQAISEAGDFHSALGVALRKICESTGWDLGEAWIPAADTAALELSPAWYGIGERLERFRKSTTGIRRTPSRGLIGRVWASKQPEWNPDVSVSPLFYRAEAARQAGLKATLAVPIVADNQVQAVLVFFMSESCEEDKRLIEIVSAVAGQLGSLIQRKRAEQALQESQRRFRGIFDQTFQLTGLLKPDGTLLEANQTALDFRRLKRSDVIGRPFWETPWWDISTETQNRLRAAIETAARGNFVRYEADLLGPDGSVVTFDFSLKPLTDDDGQVVLLIPEGRNITELRRAEEALRQREADLEAIIDNSTRVIFLKDREGRYLLINCEYEKLFHITREQIKGKTDYDLFPREMAEAFRANDLKALETGAPLEFEEVVQHDDGLHTYTVNKFPLYDSQGIAYGVCGIATDITERKLLEEDLKTGRIRAENWFQRLIETTQDAVISIDRNGQIVLFNPAAEQIFGYTRAEVEGKKVDLLMAEPFAAEHNDYIGRYEHTGERRAIGRIRTATARRKNGELFPVELSVTEVSTSDEVRYAAFIRDISEKTRLQEQLIESERLAAIGTTAAKLGHEIANPLNGMSMTLQLLERRLAREAGQDAGATSAVKRLKDEITRLSQLLEDFRSISRREKYSFQPTALATVAGEVFATEMENYRARGIQVEQDFPPDLSLVVADRDKLKQALLNLCKNAVEAMPQGGTLTVRASNTGEQVVLEIMDTGVGIPAKVDIFELFSTTKASGTGLGLVIVRQIVAAHGGTITYASEPGKGTIFRLTLPIVQPLGSRQLLVSSRR
ncbi:MAG: PAS domain S-box protein [Deltaproteobacteria bacterium]|nr:PAS domain S-box protein [Deltaproteobacteria bacterium]